MAQKDFQWLGDLIASCGPLVPEILSVSRDTETSWELQFVDGDTLQFSVSPETEILTVTCPIDTLPESNKGAVLELLLAANGCWHRTAGTHYCLRETDQIIQLLHLCVSVDQPTCIAIIEDQRAKALAWKEALSDLMTEVVMTEQLKDDAALRV
ncbi:type III secretion system chaperone [Roseiconus lacunae]|uniref:type III secretion system chaperone n=1 Tax=Roseiconus lacunae TaxID=2605694 RepID=UPI001E3BACA5|nr:type III secretion system chaperone [Roseiconus lacunae]MCD0457909.1 type III secretion system chaperone [Roseiconus lacunae]